jgi:hypothetical protein
MGSAPLPVPVRNVRRWLPLGVALTIVVAQLLPHPPGVAPIRAAALFGGARFASAWSAFGVPLAAHFAGALALAWLHGDAPAAFHTLLPVVYACFALNVVLGRALRTRRGALPVAAATAVGSLLFFALTNLAVWLLLDTYPPTAEGLAACYAAGLPLLASGLLGDAAWTALFFGGHAALVRGLRTPVRSHGLA